MYTENNAEFLAKLNSILAFGLFEGEGIELLFKLIFLTSVYLFFFIQVIGAVRVKMTGTNHGHNLFIYLTKDLMIGAVVSLTLLASPIALFFYGRALMDALTISFDNTVESNAPSI